MTLPSAPLRWATACLAALLLAPAQAQSSDGGTAAPGGGLGASAPVPGGGARVPGSGPAPPAGLRPAGPNTLAPAPGGARAGSDTLVRGALTPAAAGRMVLLELQDVRHGWATIATARADAGGAFVAVWRPRQLGRFLLRARAAGGGARSARPAATIEVYRSVIATWFGPGSYGARTACGQVMTPQLVGVAHRTLPCGTMVDIAFAGQTVSLPVVDRGPYAAGVSLDLTAAAARALGVSDTVRVGAAVVRGNAATAP